jgi:hypothetical protein
MMKADVSTTFGLGILFDTSCRKVSISFTDVAKSPRSGGWLFVSLQFGWHIAKSFIQEISLDCWIGCSGQGITVYFRGTKSIEMSG